MADFTSIAGASLSSYGRAINSLLKGNTMTGYKEIERKVLVERAAAFEKACAEATDKSRHSWIDHVRCWKEYWGRYNELGDWLMWQVDFLGITDSLYMQFYSPIHQYIHWTTDAQGPELYSMLGRAFSGMIYAMSWDTPVRNALPPPPQSLIQECRELKDRMRATLHFVDELIEASF